MARTLTLTRHYCNVDLAPNPEELVDGETSHRCGLRGDQAVRVAGWLNIFPWIGTQKELDFIFDTLYILYSQP